MGLKKSGAVWQYGSVVFFKKQISFCDHLMSSFLKTMGFGVYVVAGAEEILTSGQQMKR